MEVKSIVWYDNYIASNNNVFGIDGSNVVKVDLFDNDDKELRFNNFFKKDGNIYFSVIVEEKEYCFEQSIKELKSITKLPDEPVSFHIEAELPPYKVEKFLYEDPKTKESINTSRVYRHTLVEAYLMIDAAIKVDGGLWFSVPQSYATRLEGVYFWTLEESIRMILPTGRIW